MIAKDWMASLYTLIYTMIYHDLKTCDDPKSAIA